MNGHGSGQATIFELAPASALAWYFVLANWPDPPTRPVLRMDDGPARVALLASPEALETLRRTARLARMHGSQLGASADALLFAIGAHPVSARPATQAG